jgi:two-component system chemotaxis response regulator CheB
MPCTKKLTRFTRQSKRFFRVGTEASAGGIPALTRVLQDLPPGFPCSVLIVQHLQPAHTSRLAEVLSKRCRMPVRDAQDGEVIEAGIIYIAQPDLHLVASDDGLLHLLSSNKVNRMRPSVDTLFKSVAIHYGRRAVAVILTGSGRDGAAGLAAIKLAGGTTIAQDPDLSQFRWMPKAAVATGCVDYILPLGSIGLELERIEANLSVNADKHER